MKCVWGDAHRAHVQGDVMRLGVSRPGRDVAERADILKAAAERFGLEMVEAADHGLGPVAAVHTPEYLDFLAVAFDQWSLLEDAAATAVANVFPVRGMDGGYPASIVGRIGYHMHDQLAPIGPGTYGAAIASAAIAVDAACRVLSGERAAYALCRPSGHHAYADMGGGATYLNNAAIAAQHLRRGMDRVALIDIDVHHGNGTQGIFYDRQDVLFVSLHRDPSDFHPFYTGHAHERGRGAGQGATLNLPLPSGTGDAAYAAALATACSRIERFASGGLVVSLGFDAHVDDPSKGLALTAAGFETIGATLGRLGLPTVLVQEGGYNLATLGDLLTRFLSGFTKAHGPS